MFFLDQIHSAENIITANIILLVDGKLIILLPKTPVSVNKRDFINQSEKNLDMLL